jgi:hypothetical protein
MAMPNPSTWKTRIARSRIARRAQSGKLCQSSDGF